MRYPAFESNIVAILCYCTQVVCYLSLFPKISQNLSLLLCCSDRYMRGTSLASYMVILVATYSRAHSPLFRAVILASASQIEPREGINATEAAVGTTLPRADLTMELQEEWAPSATEAAMGVALPYAGVLGCRKVGAATVKTVVGIPLPQPGGYLQPQERTASIWSAVWAPCTSGTRIQCGHNASELVNNSGRGVLIPFLRETWRAPPDWEGIGKKLWGSRRVNVNEVVVGGRTRREWEPMRAHQRESWTSSCEWFGVWMDLEETKFACEVSLIASHWYRVKYHPS